MKNIYTNITSIAVYVLFAVLIGLALLFLGTVLPGNLRYQMRIVESGSMSPTIPIGSVVLVRAHPSYSVHDVINFKRATDLEEVTHRIIGISQVSGETVYTVQGDANNAPDQKPVLASEVIGSVWFSLPYVGYIIDFARKPIGFAIIIGIPALWMILEQVQKIRHEVVKTKRSQENSTV